MAPHLSEARDHYFTKLKALIELAKQTNGNRRVVLMGHSYGSPIIFHFMKWVEHQKTTNANANANANWVQQHVEAFINIAGPMLGVPKSLSSLVSGEMKDTAELGALSVALEYFFTPATRTALARSWFRYCLLFYDCLFVIVCLIVCLFVSV